MTEFQMKIIWKFMISPFFVSAALKQAPHSQLSSYDHGACSAGAGVHSFLPAARLRSDSAAVSSLARPFT
jgi:hypothetical protein